VCEVPCGRCGCGAGVAAGHVMLRRAFLLFFVGGAAVARAKVPTDDGQLNSFAEHYNAYVLALRDGRIDLRVWARVERAWSRLVN
jgi:hypothetical protein